MSRENQFLSDCALALVTIFCGFAAIHGKVEELNSVPSLHLSPAALKSFLGRILEQNASMRACPAPKYPLEANDCSLPPCRSPEDCPSDDQSCCFNGCVFSCVDKLRPPPVIDWVEEPKPFIPSKDEEIVMRCTSIPKPAPSEPTACPRGYVCKVDDSTTSSSEEEEAWPSTLGVCVPEAAEADYGGEPEAEGGIKEKTGKQTVYLPGGCVLSEIQYKNVQEFKKNRPYVIDCFCIEGSIECQIDGEKK